MNDCGSRLTRNSDVLQTRHELAIETAECISGQESIPSLCQVLVNFAQLREQCILGSFIFFQQH